MLPTSSTVLDLHLLWHPNDASAETIASEIEDHFLRQSCTGLHAGAIEVFRRSQPWSGQTGSPPRPIPLPGETGAAPWTAVIVLVGTELMRAAQDEKAADWCRDLKRLTEAARVEDSRIKVMAILVPGTRRPPGARLAELLGDNQYLAEPDRHALRHGGAGWLGRARCRELAQALSCWLDPKDTGAGIQVFVSHTKQSSDGPDGSAREGVGALVRQVRAALGETRLGTFYDAQSLQPGQGWAAALTENAGRCALLVLRTDLYATREWCHREVIEAKRHGRPVVVLDALTQGEARGSYLLDQVPRLPVRRDAEQWSDDDIERGINRLADAWLERVLWERQREQMDGHDATCAWLPQAPEPLTLLPLLQAGSGDLALMYPDPPLTEAERQPLEDLARAAGRSLRLSTPRMITARPMPTAAAPCPSLAGRRIGLSTSTGSPDVLADLARLGMTRHHHDLTLRAIARAVLVHGGTLAYGGNLDQTGCTPILMDEVERYAQQTPDSAANVDLDGARAPLWLVLSWTTHRSCTLEKLREVDAALSLHGRLRCLDRDGQIIDMAKDRQGMAENALPTETCLPDAAASLRAMRQHLDRETQARVLLGGKRTGYSGDAPGLLEEAILARKSPSGPRPLYLIGGLGGITAHMAAEIDPGACGDLATPGVLLDARARQAMDEFLALLGPLGSRWSALNNGLSDDDNRRLATSNRPAEIAALICRGLAQVQPAA